MSLQLPSTESPGQRQLTLQETVQRARAFTCLGNEGTPSCSKVIWTGVFFDGTNNNKDRDEKDNSHSNIVVLYNAFNESTKKGYYRYYIPGVGTPFHEIGEEHESADGKSQAKGGEARIHFAMIQIYNAVYQAVFGDELLVTDDKALEWS